VTSEAAPTVAFSPVSRPGIIVTEAPVGDEQLRRRRVALGEREGQGVVLTQHRVAAVRQLAGIHHQPQVPRRRLVSHRARPVGVQHGLVAESLQLLGHREHVALGAAESEDVARQDQAHE
jgi:hypothetical protein